MAAGILDDPHRRGLIANATAFVVAALVINGVIFALGWNLTPSATRPPLIPPGPVVGTVWTLLFALMGAARWAWLRDTPGDDRGWRVWTPVALAVGCLAYPFYTGGLANQTSAYIGTVVTLAAAIVIAGLLYRRSPLAAGLIVPTALWTGWVAMVGAIFGRI